MISITIVALFLNSPLSWALQGGAKAVMMIKGSELSKGLSIQESNQTSTSTTTKSTFAEWAFLVAENEDLFVIKKSKTGTSSTEVHVLSRASNYRSFILQTGTPLHETGSPQQFSFALAKNRDLFCIKQTLTGSHTTEVHVLSAASSYQTFILQTRTALHETGLPQQFAFAVASDNRDLFCIKQIQTGTRSTEVHVLSAASNYQSFSLQTGTALHETPQGWSFALANNRDVFGIKKNLTGTLRTEIHVLQASNNYQSFSLQTGTALHETGAPYDFAFAVASNRALFAIKKIITGTRSTEVHVLPASNYYSFSLQTGTGLHETGVCPIVGKYVGTSKLTVKGRKATGSCSEDDPNCKEAICANADIEFSSDASSSPSCQNLTITISPHCRAPAVTAACTAKPNQPTNYFIPYFKASCEVSNGARPSINVDAVLTQNDLVWNLGSHDGVFGSIIATKQ
mmetsp:Transcript_6887/g.16891  ORF Transcript_6887/g.16891 Transcript_6887/m.16891 type:complete len:456 (+) Transcript_6887:1-1368(+)